ncbi:putative transposase [Escherichia phage phi456]|uniref:Transposase n=1 Tax=Escherichia phage phi456 TaxID=3075925 RepID=A0AA96ENI7_9CAUD|nr:putative transposase [Escherichia phage phi456]
MSGDSGGQSNWYNNRRLLERLGHIPPAEAEKAYYASIGNTDLAA